MFLDEPWFMLLLRLLVVIINHRLWFEVIYYRSFNKVFFIVKILTIILIVFSYHYNNIFYNLRIYNFLKRKNLILSHKYAEYILFVFLHYHLWLLQIYPFILFLIYLFGILGIKNLNLYLLLYQQYIDWFFQLVYYWYRY